ncbi:MAG: SRPBCC domain-containing protein [Acidimicrobiales bacterium]|nr:SRPBCC domain-containing protein [Acidimicrobiales bacterium]
MEFGSIEREVQINASPATVFEVITSPAHLREWWPDDAVLEPVPGAKGHLVFGDPASGEAQIPQVTVVDAVADRLFSFRWTHPEGEDAAEGNSLLVTFELAPSDGGTLLRMTESGFREMGWEVAVLEETYNDHVAGWGHFLPRLVDYAPTVVVAA